MADRLAAADLTIGNLESTLSKAGAPRQGGDSFGARPDVRRGLRLAGFDVLSLANNHSGDYGPRALVRTVERLRAGGFRPVGAGRDLAAAARPVVVERDGTTFGVVAFDAIGETPAATAESPGALRLRMQPRTGPLDEGDLRRVLGIVRRLDRQVDVVLVVPHWGTQYTHAPFATSASVARALVRAGADVVAGGHPHWVQGVEAVGGGLIAYSLGNFVFDMDFMQQTQEGFVLELTFWGARSRTPGWCPMSSVPTSRRAGRKVRGATRSWPTSGEPARHRCADRTPADRDADRARAGLRSAVSAAPATARGPDRPGRAGVG